jgi:hypothetical protein
MNAFSRTRFPTAGDLFDPGSNSMRHPSFKYDVAFSFLERDEDLAVQVDTLLHGRVKTFIPSRREALLAHTDFEQTVHRVFGGETRIVTVLYRDSWGRTGCTLLEESAIRHRAHEDGYDFILLIPLDTPPSLPSWIPKKQSWLGFNRWGVEGMAAVIDARVQQAGGPTHEETPLERAQHLERERVFEEERQAFLNSQEGVRAAQSELAKLFNDIDRISNEINKTTRKISIHLERDEKNLVLSAHGLSLDVTWVLRSPNTLEKSALHVMLWRGLFPVHGAAFEKPRRLETTEFHFDRNSAGDVGWHESERKDRFFTSAELAEECVNLLLNTIPRDRRED